MRQYLRIGKIISLHGIKGEVKVFPTTDDIERFDDLVAWQKARALTSKIYAATRIGQFAKDFGLIDQIRRAAVSIGSNIAEGSEKGNNKEFVTFLGVAKGSA